MAINHSECTHPRTPAGRAACRRASSHIPEHDAPATRKARENVVEAPKERRPRNVTQTRLPSAEDVLRGLDEVPVSIRKFLAAARTKNLRIQPNRVDRGTSFHVLSEEGAITVTWDGDEVAWFARRGFSSLSRRIEFKEVWNTLDGK